MAKRPLHQKKIGLTEDRLVIRIGGGTIRSRSESSATIGRAPDPDPIGQYRLGRGPPLP